MKIYNGYERLPRNYSLFEDEYANLMANGYFKTSKGDQEATFDLFFRKFPNGENYLVMAGLDKVIPYIQNLRFEETELDYFRRAGYDEGFINEMRNFKFTGDIYAIPDGTPVFPNEPLLTVKAPLPQAQIIEASLLCIFNGALSHSTAARRIVEALPKNANAVNVGVMEFGSRRGDGHEAAIDSAIYGIMAGCIGTSNSIAANMLNMIALGTMAHSWVTSFDTELESFLAYAKIYPNNCTLLVDTYDTLKSGIPNAIKTFNYMKDNGLSIDHIGIRIDSGDLSDLSKKARKMLDEAGFPQARICMSNGLTAEAIEELVLNGAKFDSFGVGDNISKPDGRIGAVYKEVAVKKLEQVELESNSVWNPTIKISEDEIKILNPGRKNLYRAYDKDTGIALADIITRKGEKITKDNITVIDLTNRNIRLDLANFRLEELMKPIFINGELVYYDPEILEKQAYCNSQMQTISEKVRRTTNPDKYYTTGTEEYLNFKEDVQKRAKIRNINVF